MLTAKAGNTESPEQFIEIESKRTPSSKTYQNSDGSCSYVSYAYDIHFLGEDGKYYEIDNTIIPSEEKGFLYTNAANAWKVLFASDKLELIKEDKRITVTLPESESVFLMKDVKKTDSEYFRQKEDSENVIVYKYNGFCIVYSVLPGALKEDIVIEREDAVSDFTFEYCFENELSLDNKNSLKFVDSEGNKVFEFAGLYMYDAAENRSDAVTTECRLTEDGASVTVKPDRGFFNEETAYPVIIDPSIEVSGSANTYDTCVDEQYPNSNYYLSQNLWTGGTSGTNRMRSFVKFNLPSGITGNQITRARILIKKNGYETPTIKAFRVTQDWTSSAITWNNQPEFDATNYSTPIVSMGSDWYSLEVTGMVVDFKLLLKPYYGFVLREYYENNANQKTRFYSSDASAGNIPVLCIDYVNSLGSRPYQATSTNQVNCMGYALDVKTWISANDIGINDTNLYGKTVDQILDYVKEKAEAWMHNNLGGENGFQEISSFDANIHTTSPGWFRVVLRVGIYDPNNNGLLDTNEMWDYHWWYQTNNMNGCWAQKQGRLSSEFMINTNGVDPQTFEWNNGLFCYESDCIYYEIKDSRSPLW